MSDKNIRRKSDLAAHDKIIVRGARVNNLKNVDVDIPRNRLVVVTGLSGSGKSSLAFDTLYAEGNRRYMEGLSAYVRNFLDLGARPDVDKVENLSPAISIDQKSVVRSSRSTVGTMTETYDYLRVLFARLGKAHCPDCGKLMERRNNKEILKELMVFPDNTQIAILANPAPENDIRSVADILRQIQQKGYARVCWQGKIMTVQEALLVTGDVPAGPLDVVIDRVTLNHKNPDEERIVDSIETAMKAGNGSMSILIDNQERREYNQDFVCSSCGIRIREITPRHFSFNNPEGACPKCSGSGLVQKVNPDFILPNKSLSLCEGAVRPWSKAERRVDGSSSYLGLLKNLSKAYGISLKMPVKKLPEWQIKIVLYGSNGYAEHSGVDGIAGQRRGGLYFEGVIPELEKRYRETKSEYMRSEIEKYMDIFTCPVCEGKKLKREYLSILFAERSIDDLVNLDVTGLKKFFQGLDESNLTGEGRKVFSSIAREMIKRLESLENVGLEYLSLSRNAQSISGGEAQRIRLAVQINAQLMGVLYVLDEPSIGLHSRDTAKLISTMRSLQDIGNSLVVVEHDAQIMRASDWIIDMGPGAGEDGGEIIFQGDLPKLLKAKTATAEYLLGKKKVFVKKSYRKGNGKYLELVGAKENNLQNVDFKIPLGKFVGVCGVSGSGKSTLVTDILAKALSRHFYGAKDSPGRHERLKGLEHIDKVISIDQGPIGRTPRSNAATYTGTFSLIRDIFAELEESQNRGYTASRFSFNMKGGRCEVCQGDGMKKIEMHLLPDVYVKCEACEGTGYNKKTLEIEFKGYNIAQVLEMDVNFALHFFAKHPLITEKLRTMQEVGLGYLKLGQSATNLSGGEAQRIKLATELARKSTGRTLYILDEPTIGLHFEDTSRLLKVLDALVEKGNTVVLVEHNLDVIRSSDWLVELGPEGGKGGGRIIFEGTPDKLKKCKESWTAKYL